MKVALFLDRFREVVASGPARIAIEAGAVRLSFGELLARSTRIGQELRRRGVGPGARVGLSIEKSPLYVQALLGVWLAGGAFVPIDPALPDKMRDFMIRDAGLTVLLSRQGRRLRFARLRPTKSRARAVRPSDPAYLIYTSGTTGWPKGVSVPQRGIVNLLDAQIGEFGLDRSSRNLLYLSTSFDASVSDIGTTLLSGATLCIEPDASLRPASRLVSVLARRKITHLDLPPSLLRVLDPQALPASLATLIIGGEASAPEVVRRFAKRFRVVNVYGPTEATVCASMCRCDPATWTRPLLGKPLPGVHWQVVDGELLIGGIGLADGYRNLPELTATRFILRNGERFFRTGDRVLEHADGEIEFKGRIDRQTKIRGHRIELEGIEAQLAAQPGVAEAAVIKRTLPRPMLVAFVSPHARRSPPDPSALRQGLRHALAPWMIPHRIEVLPSLPRTATGKVDLQALLARPLPPDRRKMRAPSSPLQHRLARIWKQVLGTGPVGIHDDFYDDLGGDSLALMSMLAAAEASGLPVRSAWFPRCRTIETLAAKIEAAGSRGRSLSAARLRSDVALPRSRRRLTKASRPRNPPRSILLTGATGFLGSRLLAELLNRTDAVVHCLVRDPHPLPGPSDRIKSVGGDLEQSRLGLSAATWNRLADGIDAVYHCAARVDMLLPYSRLRSPNVMGTREILRLVNAGKPKALHHISTLSVFVSTDANTGPMREDDALDRTRRIYGGYAQSKWAAEHLLRASGAEPISYYRLGLLTGDSRTGKASPREMLSMFLSGVSGLASVPASAGSLLKVDITPVDFAAAAIVHLSLTGKAGTFHIANPRSASMASLLEALQSEGVAVSVDSDRRWQARMARAAAKGMDPAQSAAMLALCRCLPAGAFGRHRAIDLFQATGAEFRMENTLAGLSGSGLRCPAPTPGLLRLYARTALSS